MRIASMVGTTLLISAWAAQAASVFTFSGTFSHDDQIQGFTYTVQTAGPVQVSTTSYGSGLPGSGFLPVLTIFDGNPPGGNFLFDDETAYTRNADATLSWYSQANVTYWVFITEYNNVWDQLGNNWSVSGDPFHDPDFTGALYGLGAGPFYGPGPTLSGAQLTGNWSVKFESADPLLEAAPSGGAVPEPASWVVLSAGLAAIACARKFRSIH